MGTKRPTQITVMRKTLRALGNWREQEALEQAMLMRLADKLLDSTSALSLAIAPPTSRPSTPEPRDSGKSWALTLDLAQRAKDGELTDGEADALSRAWSGAPDV